MEVFMMRTLLLSLVLLPLPAIGAFAQQVVPTAPSAGSKWEHVQALPAGTTIYVNANGRTTRCALTSVDADTLTCVRGKPIAFPRTGISTIKLPRRALSTAILAGAGAGLGALVVKGVASGIDVTEGKAKGSVYAGGAGIGAVVFGPIGYFTDFARSTVYQAR
jgi:hypothetical protein